MTHCMPKIGLDLKQLIEFKQCLKNDLLRVKHENSKLQDEVLKKYWVVI